MSRAAHSARREDAERVALRRRVRQFYASFNRGLWEKCFAFIDPRLIEQSKVPLPVYAERLSAFRRVYGGIHPWLIRISLHLDASSNKHDRRPFAYVYVVWQDDARGFHMFRERWVSDSGRWFTRVVGLVPNQQETVQSQD